jgi:hypothetical protein
VFDGDLGPGSSIPAEGIRKHSAHLARPEMELRTMHIKGKEHAGLNEARWPQLLDLGS